MPDNNTPFEYISGIVGLSSKAFAIGEQFYFLGISECYDLLFGIFGTVPIRVIGLLSDFHIIPIKAFSSRHNSNTDYRLLGLEHSLDEPCLWIGA